MEARRRASTTDHAGGWPEGTARPPPTAPCGSTGRAGPPRHPWRLVSQKSLAAHIQIFQQPARAGDTTMIFGATVSASALHEPPVRLLLNPTLEVGRLR